MSSIAYSHCPVCDKWVPAEKMHFEIRHTEGEENPNGTVVRECDWCHNGLHTPDMYFSDSGIKIVQCIWCDSYDTEEISPGTYKCYECGETFIL